MTSESLAQVCIVPLAPEHAPGLQRIASDPRVQATTLLPEPYPADGAASFIAYARGAWGREYAWALVASGEVVGRPD
ncbi:MAG: GNAT family N-acetyltransferase [Bacteroidota bacterium]